MAGSLAVPKQDHKTQPCSAWALVESSPEEVGALNIAAQALVGVEVLGKFMPYKL